MCVDGTSRSWSFELKFGQFEINRLADLLSDLPRRSCVRYGEEIGREKILNSLFHNLIFKKIANPSGLLLRNYMISTQQVDAFSSRVSSLLHLGTFISAHDHPIRQSHRSKVMVQVKKWSSTYLSDIEKTSEIPKLSVNCALILLMNLNEEPEITVGRVDLLPTFE